MKYAALRQSSGEFLRGACSLFYHRVREAETPPSPSLWICGDVHVGNYGVYEGDDGRLRFDLNDFDEACEAPCLLDLLRLLVALKCSDGEPHRAEEMAKRALRSYIDACLGDVDAALDGSTQALSQLFQLAYKRDREHWVKERMEHHASGWEFKVNAEKTLRATDEEQVATAGSTQQIEAQSANHRQFITLDVARRVSGVGSLGLPRFLLAVIEPGSQLPLCLDVKAARPSVVVEAGLGHRTGRDADRILRAQRIVLERPTDPIAAVRVLGDQFTVREVQPCAVRLDPSFVYPPKVGEVLGEALGRAHRRSANRTQASSALNDLSRRNETWRHVLMLQADLLSAGVRNDWQAYCKAYDGGAFG